MKYYVAHNTDWANSILERYDSDTVGFVKEYKDYIDGLIIMKFQGDDLVELPNDSAVHALHSQYVGIALIEGMITEKHEFDDIFDAICVLSK